MAYVPLFGLIGTCVPRTRTVVAAEPRCPATDAAGWDAGLDPAAALCATQAPVTPSTSPASRVSVEPSSGQAVDAPPTP